MPPVLRLDEDAKPLSRKWDSGTSGSGGSDFQQQGAVDWVDLTKTSISFSFGILSRLSAASVDAYTITVGHLIGGAFQLSRGGRSNVEGALSKLKSFGSLGDVLWFGFGLRHLVRSLSVTEQGATLVALCAALAESFSDDAAAEILYEMVKLNTDSTSTPSPRQWRALVKCCAGTFAVTDFPTRAEAFMAMQVDGGLSSTFSRYNVDAEPVAVANALAGIGKLSCGEWTAIEISGGREAGWLAAVGEWLFNLTVSIKDEHGFLKYTSCPSNQSPQIEIHYLSNSMQRGQGGSQVAVMKKSFNLHSIDDLINADTRLKTTTVTSVSGRVQWDKCLSASFGKGFETLKTLSTTVGTVIGSAARMFEAIARAEEDVPFEMLERNQLYMDAAFGSGLLQTAVGWLPELLPFEDVIESASMAMSYTDAKSKYEANLAKLSTTCDCMICGVRSRETYNKPCLVAMVETIIVLCRLLATTECAPDLFPHRLGLKKFLEDQKYKRQPHVMEGADTAPFLRVFLRPETPDEPTIIADALCLFTGRKISDMDEQYGEYPAAVSVGGICVYYDSLREVSDSRQLTSRIHVVPGKIERDDRPYYYLEDRALAFQWRNRAAIDDETWEKLQDQAALDRVNLSVRESLRALEVWYEILDSAGHSVGMTLSPRQLVLKSSESRGLVSCSTSHPGAGHIGRTPDQTLLDQLKAADVDFRMLRSPMLGRCVALMIESEGTVLILRDKECMDCCVKAALKKNPRQIIVISKPTKAS